MFNLFSIFNTILKWVGNLYREGRLVKYIFINITIFIFIGCISYYYYFYLEFNLGDVVSLEVVSFYISFIVSFLISSFVFDKFKYSDILIIRWLQKFVFLTIFLIIFIFIFIFLSLYFGLEFVIKINHVQDNNPDISSIPSSDPFSINSPNEYSMFGSPLEDLFFYSFLSNVFIFIFILVILLLIKIFNRFY